MASTSVRVAGARVVAVGMAAALLAACTGDSRSTGREVERSNRRAAVDVTSATIRAVPAGKGIAQSSAQAPGVTEPLPPGYRESELLVSGRASIYAGDATGPAQVKSANHPFTTRVLVRSPRDPKRFSGRVWLEPFNTSGGGEFGAVWGSIAPLIEQRGDAWIGVTVRANQVGRLQQFDAARYADLDLVENAYAWDVLRTVGALLKGRPAANPIGEWPVEHAYLGGYSQSAVDAATFASAFHATTRLRDGSPVYDGYLIGARDANLTPLQSGISIIPKFETARMRTLDVPVVDVEPQTDVEGFAVEVPTSLLQEAGVAGADEITTPTFIYTNAGGAAVRRPDRDATDDRFHLLEIPGAPHVTGGGNGCDGSSSFPTRYFVRAAAHRLARWVEEGDTPPEVPRIALAVRDDVSVARNDEVGNAVGGLRSPFVDVPLARYEVHSGPAPTCKQVGVETPLARDVLLQRYGSEQEYMVQFTDSLDATIDRGFLLPSDRTAILEVQQARAAEVFAAP